MQTPTLETERLILRAPAQEDFEAWADFCADEEAARFIGGRQDRIGAWRIMCVMAGAWTVRGFSMFSVIEKATSRWVGRLGPWQPEGWPGTEVGWGIVRDAWGKGYATEGATAAIDWAFDALGWDEVIHTIEPANVNSQKVAERLGSRILRQAVLPAPMNVAVDCWGQSRAEWLARRR
ncbi:GNAT family N-acetyltransferase [Phenylobacterium kunshanense]|uniref:N-acetyltransferase n=1 Tax=Phenylobacterium kunshanense TaxID=1445034 RepID=A0A328BM01_9CAUL|nr:GNAT family N-acetyltransferase [Phenylobacterium kunshanense]RAK67461.1 N-acetyltransferase [Phenylobacterium kunshanense]